MFPVLLHREVPVVKDNVGVVTVPPALRTLIEGATVQVVDAVDTAAIDSTVTALLIEALEKTAAIMFPGRVPDTKTMRGASLIVVVPMTGAVSVLAVSICVAPRVTTVSLVPGNVIFVPSVPANSSVLSAFKVLPSRIVSVTPVAGGVKVTLLTLVAVATPMFGVVRLGDVASTTAPDPLTPLLKSAAASCALTKLVPLPRSTFPDVAAEAI